MQFCVRNLLVVCLLLVWSGSGWGPLCAQPSEGTGYWCQEQWVSFELDPAAMALELFSFDKSFIDNLTQQATVVEVLPGNRRLILDWTRAERAKQFFAAKQSIQYDSYPVYLYRKDGSRHTFFGELVVCFNKGTQSDQAGEVCSRFDWQPLDWSGFEHGVLLVKCLKGNPLDYCRDSQPPDSSIVWLEPNLYGGRRLQQTPNDPLFSNQQHLAIIEATRAWQINAGAPDIVVAVVDDGIDINHPDLVNNIWDNPGEYPDLADTDQNGYVDDFHGWNFANDNNDVIPGTCPSCAHGTAVAGVIAAERNNNLGVVGVAPGCKVLSARLFTPGYAGDFKASQALRYAADHADVVNCSWGGGAPSQQIIDSIDYGVTFGRNGLGCVFLFASGNDYGAPVDFPGNYEWAMAVGETINAATRHEESNLGRELTVVAPMANWTTDNHGSSNGFDNPMPDYTSDFGGTSSACPVASGVAALVLSQNPGLTTEEVVDVIVAGATNPRPDGLGYDTHGQSPTLGYGMVNAYRSVAMAYMNPGDRLSPNQTPGAAPSVSCGWFEWQSLKGFSEYIQLDGDVGAPILCSIRCLPALSNIDLELLDSGLRSLVRSTASGAWDTIGYTPETAGKLYLRIFHNQEARAPYKLRVVTSRVDDEYEPNNSMAQATLLGTESTYSDLVLNDPDWYCLDARGDQYLYSLLTFDQSWGTINYSLLNSSGTLLKTGEHLNHGQQILPFDIPSEDMYYLHVYGVEGAFNPQYSLHVRLLDSPPLTGTQDDGFEDNDRVADAAPITAGFYPNLAISSQLDEVRDIFRFEAPEDKVTRVTVAFAPPADLDLFLYDERVMADPPNAPKLAWSKMFTPPLESLFLPPFAAPTPLWLDVVTNNNGVPYRLALDFLTPLTDQFQVAYWRFCESNGVNTAVSTELIRDWRGPQFSHSPQAYPGLGAWQSGPDPIFFPGADAYALDCSNAGIYFPNNGQQKELRLDQQDFTLWLRVRPNHNDARRTLGGYPGSWELVIQPDNRMDLLVTSASGTYSMMSGSGPKVFPEVWQDVALVYEHDRQSGYLYSSNISGLVKTSLPTFNLSLSPSAQFHLGASAGGFYPLGHLEQVRLFGRALQQEELQSFSVLGLPSTNKNWDLYR